MTWQRDKHRPRLNPAKIKDNSICNRGNFVKQMAVVTLSQAKLVVFKIACMQTRL